jgi:2-polyprenyl-3-methyl-5-hydroxy-6-metoxy-1,4-benzoquinol methylase
MIATPWCQTRDESGTDYLVQMCQPCGTAFLWPAPSEAVLVRAYATDYYGAGDTKFNPAVERFRDCFSKIRARRLTRGLKPGARILDVGCGDGRLLRSFQRVGPFDLHGIELPGRAAERAARTPGIQVHLGTLETTEFPAASFDLITLVHVYEHLAAPRDTLDRLANLLRPGGRLFLSFPNITSWQARVSKGDWFHLDPPRHLSLVPPRVVVAHLESKGLILRDGSHLCLEQNIYGWIQSSLNRCDRHRNFLYERLKRNHSYVPNRGRGSVAMHALLGSLVFVPAILLDCASAAARAGATVELTFQRAPAS